MFPLKFSPAVWFSASWTKAPFNLWWEGVGWQSLQVLVCFLKNSFLNEWVSHFLWSQYLSPPFPCFVDCNDCQTWTTSTVTIASWTGGEECEKFVKYEPRVTESGWRGCQETETYSGEEHWRVNILDKRNTSRLICTLSFWQHPHPSVLASP